MAEQFRGIYPALATPMTADEEVDYKTLAEFVDYLIVEGKVHGIVPLGSTGEFYALSDRERSEVLKIVIQTAAGRVPVIAGANAGSTRDVLRYCQEAEKLGASGVLLAPPYYSLPCEDEIYEHYRVVNQSLGIPIMLYNYPARAGVDMHPDLIERLAGLKHVRYVKESSGDIKRVSEIIRRLGDAITVFCGHDSASLECFLLGARGWISGVANVLPGVHVEIYKKAAVNGDYSGAKALFYKLAAFLADFGSGGKYIQHVKAGCGLMGRPVGPPRRPLMPIGADETARLKKSLDEFRR